MGRTRSRKVIQAELSVKGIENLVNQVKQYKEGLKKANDVFVQRLAETGFVIAQSCIQNCDHYDDDKPIGALTINSISTGEIASVKLKFSGEQVLFIEFGSGITYNPVDNPLASQFGYGIGTYPNQTHAFDKGGWSYKDDTGKWKHSKGTQATMPMYNASVTMRDRLINIAKEVYSGVI